MKKKKISDIICFGLSIISLHSRITPFQLFLFNLGYKKYKIDREY